MTDSLRSFHGFSGDFTIIGTGRVGSSLARALYRRGYRLRSLYSRTAEHGRILAAQTESRYCGRFPEHPDDLGEVVFLCLPDDQLPVYAGQMAKWLQGHPDGHMSGRIWIHTSGTHSSDVLHPVAGEGLSAGFHPVQTFPSRERTTAFDGCFVTLQGSRSLCEKLKGLVAALGARPLIVDRRQKQAIHLSAVFVSNYMASLFHAARCILAEYGVEVRSQELLRPLVEQTVAGLLEKTPVEVLTGPVARGDAGTVARHLDLLESLPEIRELYASLGRTALDIVAETPGRDLSADDEIRQLLSEKRKDDHAG